MDSALILKWIRRVLSVLAFVSVLVELIVYPLLPNIYGCVMMIVSLCCFLPFCNPQYLQRYPFSFVMLLPLFFYRFLPVPATLLEMRPVSFGIHYPVWTFFGESMLFIVIASAFYFACPLKLNARSLLRGILKSFGAFRIIGESEIWIIGAVGFVIYVVTLFASIGSGTGSLMNVLANFVFLKNAPMLLLFPNLSGLKMVKTSRFAVFVFYLVQFVITLAANSRHMLITPIVLFALLLLLDIGTTQYREFKFPFWKICGGLAFAFFMSGIISDISTAMLYTRAIRADVSRKDLMMETYKVYKDKEMLMQLKNANLSKKENNNPSYDDGWTEEYLDNFLLNRFCNVRITDIGLYYAGMLDDNGSAVLRNEYFGRIIGLLPNFIVGDMGVKEYFNYSPGDKLYALAIQSNQAIGSRVVISELADGFAVFGAFFIGIYFFLRILIFKLVNALTDANGNGVYVYSMFGLVSVYDYFIGQTNVSGSIMILYFCLRGFWLSLLIWTAVTWLASLFVRSISSQG